MPLPVAIDRSVDGHAAGALFLSRLNPSWFEGAMDAAEYGWVDRERFFSHVLRNIHVPAALVGGKGHPHLGYQRLWRGFTDHAKERDTEVEAKES